MMDAIAAGQTFPVILIDPPWEYSVFSKKGEGRSASQHYPTMTLEQICALPIELLAEKNAHLFLWMTGPGLVRGDHVKVCEAWGFRPSSMAFVWIKTKVAFSSGNLFSFMLDEACFGKGMGHTTRQNAEFVVLCRRGSPRRKSKSIHQIIVAPRRQHSRKPDEIYRRIEAYADGPYLEVFARQQWPVWTSAGNEIDKFKVAP